MQTCVKTCEYRDNPFCSNLCEEDCRALCASCTVRRYQRGSHHNRAFWEAGACLLLRGIMATFDPADGVEPRCAVSIARSDAFVGGSAAWFSDDIRRVMQDVPDQETLCVTDCTVAWFDLSVARRLYEAKGTFQTEVTRRIVSHGIVAKNRFVTQVGEGSVYQAVRYVLEIARDCREVLTHEQIAFLTGRNRSTVTQTMHQVALREPDLLAW